MGVLQSAEDLVAVVDDIKTDGSARFETMPLSGNCPLMRVCDVTVSKC